MSEQGFLGLPGISTPVKRASKPCWRSGLRSYQIDGVQTALEQLTSGECRSTLIVAATGTGKTQTFCTIAHEWEYGRVLIMAHRSELIQQAAGRLESMSSGEYIVGLDIGIEQADLRSCKSNHFVVASVQSIYREDRLARLKRDGGFGLIIVDEAHHAPASTYKKVFNAFPEAKILGVTATPDRSDEQAMGRVFEDIALEYDVENGINDGYLVPIKGREIFIQSLDLSRVSVVKGDFAKAELDDEICDSADGMVSELVKMVPPGDKQGIVFCPGVKTAHYMAERLNTVSPGIAAAIDGKTEQFERQSIMERFRKGEIQWLTNCMVATEGFDAPSVSVVVCARPTKSRALYAQMVGRGTRVLPGLVDRLGTPEARRTAIAGSAKPNMLVVDFVGNSSHSLCSPADLLGGKYTDEEKKQAKKLDDAQKERGEEVDPLINLEEARALLKSIAKARGSISTKATVRDFSPFGEIGYNPEEDRKYCQRFGHKPMSEKQREALAKMGIPRSELDKLSKHGANQLFKKFNKRREQGLATLKQQKLLQSFGVFNAKITFKNAGAAMEYLAKQGWGRRGKIDPIKLQKIASGE